MNQSSEYITMVTAKSSGFLLHIWKVTSSNHSCKIYVHWLKLS